MAYCPFTQELAQCAYKSMTLENISVRIKLPCDAAAPCVNFKSL